MIDRTSIDTFDNIFDREGWPPGEWDKEPDRATWVHDATGARCTIRRGPLGAWCGYVGVRGNHPAAGKDYDDLDVGVHGGLTFAGYCHPIEEDEWIRYRILREKLLTESLIHPDGDAARLLRQDRKANTSTLIGFKEYARLHNLCHDDCPHGLWWVGFDAAHGEDIIPGMPRWRIVNPFDGLVGRRSTYKNFEWMVEETNQLAEELFKEEIIKEGKA